MVRTPPSFSHSGLSALLKMKKIRMNRNNIPRPERPLQSFARPEGLQTGFIRTYIGAAAFDFSAGIPNSHAICIPNEPDQLLLITLGVAGYAGPYGYMPFSSTHLQFSLFRVPDHPSRGHPPPERVLAIRFRMPIPVLCGWRSPA